MKEKLAKGGNIGFEKLSDKVAARYAGKSVAPEYQDEYGKRYDRSEAKEVGDKVAGKVYWAQRRKAKMAEGGEVGVGGTMDSSTGNDPMIGGTMASSMFAKGGYVVSKDGTVYPTYVDVDNLITDENVYGSMQNLSNELLIKRYKKDPDAYSPEYLMRSKWYNDRGFDMFAKGDYVVSKDGTVYPPYVDVDNLITDENVYGSMQNLSNELLIKRYKKDPDAYSPEYLMRSKWYNDRGFDMFAKGGKVGNPITLKSPYNKNGEFMEWAAKDNIREIMNRVPFRKFGNEFRKHIDPQFSQEFNIERVNTGITWSELASYIIGDGDFTVDKRQYESFISAFNVAYN